MNKYLRIVNYSQAHWLLLRSLLRLSCCLTTEVKQHAPIIRFMGLVRSLMAASFFHIGCASSYAIINARKSYHIPK